MRISIIIRFVCFIAVMCLMVTTGTSAQQLYPMGGPGQKIGFHVDYSWFDSNQEGKVLLEVYYKVFNKYLTFVRESGDYQATYEVTIALYSGRDEQIDGHVKQRSFTVPSYSKTLSDVDFRVSQVNFLVPPGKYKIKSTLTDKNAGTSVEREMKVELDDFDSRHAELSGVEFVYVVDSARDNSPFNKDKWSIIPSVIRSYGGDSVVPLLYYHEIYQGQDGREEVFIDTRVLNHKYDAVYYDTLTSIFYDNIIRQIRHVTLSGIPSGDYYLDITLRGRRNKSLDNIRTPFRISWSPEALFRNDFKTALKQIEYIGKSDEIKELKEATTSEARMSAWNNFWFRRDPTPNTVRNEAKEDYYRRIEYTNRYFSLLGKEGWRTDRGRIYIQYGEPDQIEDFPFEAINEFAYQVWYYYQIGIRRKFTFEDRWGDGDYRLRYPYDGIIR